MEPKAKERLEEFLHRREILKELRRIAREGQKSLVVAFDRLLEFDMELAKSLLDNPVDFLDTADEILGGITKLPGMRLRVMGLDKSVEIRKIRAGHVGKFIQVEGILTRAGEVKPEATEAVFKCRRCGEKNRVLQVGEFFREPLVCVSPDSKVLLDDGFVKTIDELKSCWKHHGVMAFDAETQGFKPSQCGGYVQLKPHTAVFKLSTLTGRSIIATGDHPFWTFHGWRQLRDLRIGDKVAVHPHVEVEEERGDEFIIINEAILSKLVEKIRAQRHAHAKKLIVEEKIKELKKRGWLPLSSSNEHLPIFARLLGHLFGDGFVTLSKHTDVSYGALGFTGAKEDLELIRRDLDKLGVKYSKIFTHYSESKVGGRTIRGVTTNFVVSDTLLLLLMIALGAPTGVKADVPYDVPSWVKRAPRHIKHEFLAAYFGSEGCAPTLNPDKHFSFDSISLPLSKLNELLSNARKFLSSIRMLLKEFGVESRIRMRARTYKRKDGKETINSILYVKNSDFNVLNFLKLVGYKYCVHKQKQGLRVRAYLEYKQATKKKLMIRKNDSKVLRHLEKIENALDYVASKKSAQVKDISEHLGFSISSVYRLVRKASELGFLKLESNQPRVRITAGGMEVLARLNDKKSLWLRGASLRLLELLAQQGADGGAGVGITKLRGISSRKSVLRVLKRLEKKGLVVFLSRPSHGRIIVKPVEHALSPLSVLPFHEWCSLQPIDQGFFWDPIISIDQVPCEDVRDLVVLRYHSFVVNGFVCHNCENPNCGRKGPFDLVIESSEFRDWQSLCIQEPPEKLRGGRMPRRLDGIVRDDFVDKAVPGNHVMLTGILRVFQEGRRQERKKTFRKILFVSHIEVLQKGVEEAELTPEDKAQIKELAKDPWVRNKIIQSIAPSIYGHDAIKEAIALQLFGCEAIDLLDGTRIRGDTHVLLTGDPGVAKSQILKWAANVAPRGLYTSGMKATGAGLTAAAVRDEISGGWALEAG
ncbi:MAG: LAGLIDADG family homing endonuclease, partial [Candidatus Hadarchaeaceae archaeon]